MIQKGSIQCTVGAGNIGYLLSAVRYSCSFNTSKGDTFIYLPCFAIYRYFSVFKLVVKPVSVLLEDHRSETSCNRNITTTTLLYQLRLTLRPTALRLPVVKNRPENVVLACQRNMHLLTNLIRNYKIWKKINNRDTVLPISFKIRILILF